MHDAVELETRGIPAAVIVTSGFVHEAAVQRAALGMPGLEPVVIAHPLSTISAEEIATRAGEAARQALARWTGRDGAEEA